METVSVANVIHVAVASVISLRSITATNAAAA